MKDTSRLSRRTRVALAGLVSAAILAVVGFHVWPRPTPPARAFYYWKTQWATTPDILHALKSNDVRRLYLRFFDVEWNAAAAAPRPVAPVEFQSPLPDGIDVVPVVYLTNAVFLNIRFEDVPVLADHVWRKLSSDAGAQHLSFSQVQIDCDWSDSSRARYFHFAELLDRKLKDEHKALSATIRLHQIKYAERTGIPPVARGMLMFYNFRQIAAGSGSSSIFNADDASRYAGFIKSYPMPLDVVLPMFSWGIHSRDGNVLELMEDADASAAGAFDGFRKMSSSRFVAARSFFFHGRYFVEGDLLEMEQTTPELTRQAAALAKQGAGWKKSYGTVALFDLSDRNLAGYTTADIGGVLGQF